MDIEHFFYEHPVFRLSELTRWKKENGSASNKQAIYNLIQHHQKSGRLLRIRRELYAVIPPNATVETHPIDPYLIAAKLTEDSVLGFHTALELLGVAYSAFEQFTYLTETKPKHFELEGRWFQPVIQPAKLRTANDTLKEVETINRQGIDIRITSPARTFVDTLNQVELSGGWEEVIRSISNLAVLNIDHAIQYTLKLDSAILNAKVGYFLEQREDAFAPTEIQISKLLKQRPTAPRYVTRKLAEPCHLITKWNIMLPTSVIEKHWEEPDHDV